MALLFVEALTPLLGEMLAKITVGAAMTAISRRMMAQQNRRQYKVETNINTMGGTVAQNFIFGRTRVPAHVVAPFYAFGSGNRYRAQVLQFSSVPVTGFVGFWVGKYRFKVADMVLDACPTGVGQALTPALPHESHGKVHFRIYTGDQTEADAGLVNVAQSHAKRPWTDTKKGIGNAYVVAIFGDLGHWLREQDVTAEIDGGVFFDPRIGAEVFTKNPIVIAYNVLRGIMLPDGEFYGYGLPDFRVPVGEWSAAMDAADALGLEVNGVCGMGSDDTSNAISAANFFELLMESAGADYACVRGIWRVRVGGPRLPVAFISEGSLPEDAAESASPVVPVADTVNAILATYIDRKNGYVERQLKERTDDAAIARDGRKRLAEPQFPFVHKNKIVQELVAAMLRDAARRRAHTIALPVGLVEVEPLDTVAFTSARHGYKDKLFEVTERSVDGDGHIAVYALREVEPDDWIGRAGDVIEQEPIGDDLVARPEGILTGFAFAGLPVVAQGKVRPALRVEWDPANAEFSRVKVEIRAAGSSDLIFARSFDAIDAGATIAEGIVYGGSYEARARGVKVKTAWTEWKFADAPDGGFSESDLAPDLAARITAAKADSAKALLDAGNALTALDGFAGDLVAANDAIDAANEAAGVADGRAVTAKQVADAAKTAAANAQNKANLAQSAADTADGKAVAANNAASNAQNKANLAQSAADAADGKAVAANNAAGVADGKAVAAQNAAGVADGKAVAAQNAANVVAAYLSGFELLTPVIDGAGRVVGLKGVVYVDGEGNVRTALQLEGDNVIAKGTLSASALSVGIAGNLLENADFSADMASWAFTGNGSIYDETSCYMRARGQSYSGAASQAVTMYQVGEGTGGYADFRSVLMQPSGAYTMSSVGVKAGAWYEFSAAISSKRCSGTIRAYWVDAEGALIGNTVHAGTIPNNVPSDGLNAEEWPRYGGILQAPAGAVAVSLIVRKGPTNAGGVDSWVVVSRPMVLEVPPTNNTLSPWRAGGSTLVDGGRIITNAVTADHIDVGTFAAAGLAMFGGAVRSANYVAGVSGWRIAQDGAAEFQKLITREAFAENAISETWETGATGPVKWNDFTGGDNFASNVRAGGILSFDPPTNAAAYLVSFRGESFNHSEGDETDKITPSVRRRFRLAAGGSWGPWEDVPDVVSIGYDEAGWQYWSGSWVQAGGYDRVQYEVNLHRQFDTPSWTLDERNDDYARNLSLRVQAIMN
ncbi:MAG: hypothetical protein HWE26_13655 [Alteromonadaceae bacterium]|nr:hypothetical protein [Alteromonadaceae bacterium]